MNMPRRKRVSPRRIHIIDTTTSRPSPSTQSRRPARSGLSEAARNVRIPVNTNSKKTVIAAIAQRRYSPWAACAMASLPFIVNIKTPAVM